MPAELRTGNDPSAWYKAIVIYIEILVSRNRAIVLRIKGSFFVVYRIRYLGYRVASFCFDRSYSSEYQDGKGDTHEGRGDH